MADTQNHERYLTKEEYWRDRWKQEREINERFTQISDMIDKQIRRQDKQEAAQEKMFTDLSNNICRLNETLTTVKEESDTQSKSILSLQKEPETLSPAERARQRYKLAGIILGGLVTTGGGLFGLAQLLFG